MLASREHSALELRSKLLKRGFEAESVERVLAGLTDRNLLSDARFVENYVDARICKGFGPQRIHAELRERGVDDRLIGPQLDRGDETWMALLTGVHNKKFGEQHASGCAELARRARFLEYRGFTAEQVSRFLRNDD